MGLTVTNTNTIKLLNIINNLSAQQSNTLTQLSTGKRINKGSDDPAGLIALKSLEAELTAVDGAIANNQRTDAVLSVADGALAEVSSLLTDIEALVATSSSSGGLTSGEIAANQAQIDQAISSIDRIIRTTNFNGKRLLDGSMAINRANVDSTSVTNLRIHSRGNSTSDITFGVDVTASAKAAGATLINNSGAGATSSQSRISITGTLGTATITLAAGTSQANVLTEINNAKDLTGVSAAMSGTYIRLGTTGVGSDEYVSVTVLEGTGGFTSTSNKASDVNKTLGQDATVLVNGVSCNVDGLDVSYNSNGLSMTFSLTTAFSQQTTNNSTFTVMTTGGAVFQLGTDSTTRSTLGIDALYSHNLGGGDAGALLSQLVSGGTADMNTDVATALKTVRKAIDDVANARGRVGAFQKFQVQTSINSLEAARMGLSEAASAIGDTDFALATADLNRENVLLNSGISLLGLANQQAAQILSLLG